MTGVLLDRNSRLIPDRVVAAGVDFLSPDMENNAVSIAFDANKYRAARIPAKLPPLSYSIFKEGIELENYRLITADQKTIVCLKSSQNERLWPLGSKNSCYCGPEMGRHSITLWMAMRFSIAVSASFFRRGQPDFPIKRLGNLPKKPC